MAKFHRKAMCGKNETPNRSHGIGMKDIAMIQAEMLGVLAPNLSKEIKDSLVDIFREHAKYHAALLEVLGQTKNTNAGQWELGNIRDIASKAIEQTAR